MATETGQEGTSYDGRLFELYTKYVSEPESKADVYGYTLLLIGYLLAVGGMFVYLAGPTGSEVPLSTQFVVREVSGVLAATGLVFSLLGIVSLLPVTRRSLYVAIAGTLVGLAAVALFIRYYPGNWHLGSPSYSGLIIAVYTAGVGIVAGVVIMVPVITGERSYFSETTPGPEYEHPDIAIGEADRGGLFAVFKRGTEWTWRYIDQNALASSTSSFLSRLETEERVEAVKAQVASAGLLEIKHAAFRLYEADEGRWQWLLMREDGSAVAEGGRDFDSRDGAEASINAMKDHGPDAEVFVRDDALYDCYRDDGGWRWRLVDEDRQPLALGADTHTDRTDAIAGLETFRERAGDATGLLVESYGVELRADDDNWGWRLRDSAHRHLASSAVEYGSKGVAEDAVYDLLDRLERASIVVAGDPTYDVYRSGSDWAWRLVDETGTAVARGRDTAADPEPVADAAERMRSHAGDANVVEIEDLEFETYRSGGAWHWRLVDADREVHAESTAGYDSEEAAGAVVDRVREEAPEADLIEFDTAAFQVYEAEGEGEGGDEDEGESEGGAWRWRLIDEDGTVLADSGQGEYGSKDDALAAMTTLRENAPDAEHLEIENAAFELFEDDRGWGWRLVDDIGDTIADGATRHETEDGARGAMDSLVASVSDVEERRMTGGIFQVYADDDEWQWRFVLPDGHVLAESTRSFGTRHEVETAVEDLGMYAGSAPVETIGRLAVLLDPDDWSWELVDEDRERVAASTVTYGDSEAARAAVEDIQRNAPETRVYEIRDAAFDCYESEEGWTWRLVDAEHEPIALASGTYDGTEAVESAIDVVAGAAPEAELVDYDDVAFELYGTDEGWHWRLIDEEETVLATAVERYGSRQEAERDLEAAREEISDASVIEIDSAVFEFHQTDEGWRWRLVDDSGDELAESVGTFPSRADAQEDLTTVKEFGPDAWVSVAE